MRQLLYLTGYEYRKMLKRKSLWLSFWGCFLIVLFSGILLPLMFQEAIIFP